MLTEKLIYFLIGASLMLFLVGLVQMFYRARKSHSRPHLIFGVCLCWMALIEVKEFFMNAFDVNYNEEILNPWFTFQDLFSLPLVSLFFFELTMPGRVTLRYALKILCPFVAIAAAWFVSVLLGEPQPVCLSFEELLATLPAPQTVLILLYVAYVSVYCVYATSRVVYYSLRYADEIAQAYSFDERIHLRWMRWTTILLMCYLGGTVGIISFTTSELFTLLSFLLTLIMWGTLYACIAQYRIPTIISNYWREDLSAEADVAESPVEQNGRSEMLRQQVARAIDERQLYLNPSLTIVDMAVECGTNRTQLSQFFNNELGMSFRDYINRCRIEYAVRLMASGEYKIEELAELAGFGSTTTFYRAFAKEKGMTPQRWMRRDGE